MTDQSRCRRCDASLAPVLVAPMPHDVDRPLLADPRVRVMCLTCDPPPTPAEGTPL